MPELKTLTEINVPGKIILSGEHAVVYGCPALAMAIARYATTRITQKAEANPQIVLEIPEFAHFSSHSFESLELLRARMQMRYKQFLRGDFFIKEVVQNPFELIQFTLSLCMDLLPPIRDSMQVEIRSTIPIGCGMGSSAATIMSMLWAFATRFTTNCSADTIFTYALEAENMQHGHASGLDLQIAQAGGCFLWDQQKLHTRSLPTLPFQLVHTGQPLSSTGDCVEKVAMHFHDVGLCAAFTEVTQAFDVALQTHSLQNTMRAMRENHNLLRQIGVVPDRVQDFISVIEASQGAAKICGAGSIIGDQAGMVLVLMEDQMQLTKLVERFGYILLPFTGDTRGVWERKNEYAA